jgi:1A family penicillin-binding protein
MTCVAGGMALYGFWWLRNLEARLPDVSSLANVQNNLATTIVSSDGVTLATISAQDRQPVPLSAIAPDVLNATIATEDARFYSHHGVDGRGVFRALAANLAGGNPHGQGGSTITQQLARNLYLGRQKTFTRKVEEALLALKIERRYSKRDILDAYLNSVYYGSGCYGIEAAARTYFGKPAARLDLGEATLLAGVPQRPSAYAPNQHLDAALRRRAVVLNRMVEAGYISAAQAEETERRIPHILPAPAQNILAWKAPYFVSDVVAALRRSYGNDFIYSGARIQTTLNWRLQRAAEAALHSGLQHAVANTGALVAVEPQNGYVRALVGGPDFRRCQFDAATYGARQPGSAFKPIVYVTAFDTDACNLISQYRDERSVFPGAGGDYIVHNYDGLYHGDMTVLEAIQRSINTIAVRVGAATGPDRVVQYARHLGITTLLTPGLPLALGDSAVHPIELCAAYAAFANGGVRYDPMMITSVTDAHGRLLWQDNATDRKHNAFIRQKSLDQINVALREVVLHGTAEAAADIPDAHGKTGTTSDHRDAWFVGYTANLATAIWVAREQRVSLQRGAGARRYATRYQPMSDATGGSLCAPIWRGFMHQALAASNGAKSSTGASLRLVAAPERDAMVAQLRAEAAKLAAAQKAANGNAVASTSQDTTVTVQPAGYMQAQDGSPPIIVTAPPETSGADQNPPDAQAGDQSDGPAGQTSRHQPDDTPGDDAGADK